MSSFEEKISKVGVCLVLILKSTVKHISVLGMSFVGIFNRVRNLEDPQKNFKDFDQFFKLVTEDVEESRAGKWRFDVDLLDDEQVRRIVNKNNKNLLKDEEFGIIDEEEVEESLSESGSEASPSKQHQEIEKKEEKSTNLLDSSSSGEEEDDEDSKSVEEDLI